MLLENRLTGSIPGISTTHPQEYVQIMWKLTGVNRSQHFKDPPTGVRTNHVEAYWSSVKRKFKQMTDDASP